MGQPRVGEPPGRGSNRKGGRNMQIGKKSARLGAVAATAGLAAALGLAGWSTASADPETNGEQEGHGPRMGFGRPLHSDAVVEKDDKFVSIQQQRGEVTALDESSITVKSEDGFEATYRIDSSTKFRKPGEGAEADKGQIKVGDKVMVAGTKDGDTVTAMMIGIGEPPERGQGMRGQGRGQGRGMQGGGGQSQTPTPGSNT